MTHSLKALCSTLLLVIFLSLSIASDAAQGDLSQADEREVNNYQLTEKKLGQFAQAVKNLIAAAQKNPDLLQSKEASEIMDKKGLAGLEEAFTKIPEAKKAIEDAGMTPREYWLFELATVYAASGNMIVKSGNPLPGGYSKTNVDFYKTHVAQFTALEKNMKQFQALYNNDDEEDEDDDTEDDPDSSN